MILFGIGIYLSIGAIICFTLFNIEKVREMIAVEVVFIPNKHLWIVFGTLILFVMFFWLPIIICSIIDLLFKIYKFND